MGNFKILKKFSELIDASKMSARRKRFFKISGFILLILFMKFDYIEKNVFNFDLIGNGLKQQRDVQRELNKLVSKYEKYGCTHVAINLFHNGTTALNGTHFKKMTREYEGRKEGYPVLTYKMQSFSIEPFTDEFIALDEELRLYIPNSQEYEKEYLKTFLEFNNCKSILYIAIHEKTWWGARQFVGFINFEFEKPTNFTNKQIESMSKEYDLKLRSLVKG